MGTVKIEGAIDLHCHYGPDMVGVFDGTTHSVTAVEAAQEAADSGHAALVLKAHDFATPALAHALEQVVPGIRIFGERVDLKRMVESSAKSGKKKGKGKKRGRRP